MIEASRLEGRRIAMIAFAKEPDGTDNVAVFTGVAQFRGTTLIMTRIPPESSFEVPCEWLERIRPVSEDLKDVLLDADYFFSVTVGNIDTSDAKTLHKTGLKWPSLPNPSDSYSPS